MDAVFKNTFFVSRKSIMDKAWESSGPWTRSKVHPNKHSPFSAGILDTELNKEALVQRRERRNASPKYWWRAYCMYGEGSMRGAEPVTKRTRMRRGSLSTGSPLTTPPSVTRPPARLPISRPPSKTPRTLAACLPGALEVDSVPSALPAVPAPAPPPVLPEPAAHSAAPLSSISMGAAQEASTQGMRAPGVLRDAPTASIQAPAPMGRTAHHLTASEDRRHRENFTRAE